MKGKRIVVTRALHQAEELSALLRQRGAVPLLYPCIAIAPPEDVAALDTALRLAARGDFDWLVLTSANAVPILSERLAACDIPVSRLAGIQLACVGPVTAAAVTGALGRKVQTVPETAVAEALVATLQTKMPARVLLLQADIARPVLSRELTNLGARVCALPAYRTVQGSGGVNLPNLLASHQVDAVTFTSPSTVYQCACRLKAEGGNSLELAGICLACIGPITSRAVLDLGFSVSVEPAEHTVKGLVEDLERYFQHQERACPFRSGPHFS
jgi:uroporphyrinogen-III synthase